MEENRRLETKRIILYIGITFVLTWGYCFGVIYPLNNNPDISQGASMVSQLLIVAAMFFPAIGVFLTRLITKEGLKNSWIHPHIKGNVKIYLLAYFGPGVLTLLGCVVYFLIFPKHLDLNCGYFMATLEAAGAGTEDIPMPLPALLAVQTLTALFFGPLVNFVTCFGEEWGWRGYLLPKMAEKLSPIKMLLVNGVIWGLWHAPLTAIGHNYGVGYPGFPVTGIFAMCCFCTVLGVFLSYVSLKTKSCIPAVLGHAAMNSIVAIGVYFTVDGGNPFVGPSPTGIVGGLPFVVVAVVLCVRYFGKMETKSGQERVSVKN